MKNILYSAFLFMLITLSNNGYCENNYVTDFSLATKLTKQTDQKLLVIFSSNNCMYCEQLKQDLPQISGLDNYIICILDIDNNKKIFKQFKVKNLPTSIIFDSSILEINKKIGYNQKSFQDWVDSNP